MLRKALWDPSTNGFPERLQFLPGLLGLVQELSHQFGGEGDLDATGIVGLGFVHEFECRLRNEALNRC